jgi:hypothetical protein
LFNEHKQGRSYSKEEYSNWIWTVAPADRRPMSPLDNAYARVFLDETAIGKTHKYWEGTIEKAQTVPWNSYWKALSDEINATTYLKLLSLHTGAGISLRKVLPWIKVWGDKISDTELFKYESPDGIGLHAPEPLEKDFPPRRQVSVAGTRNFPDGQKAGAIILPVNKDYSRLASGYDSYELYLKKGERFPDPRFIYMDLHANSLLDVSVILPPALTHRPAYALAVKRFREVFAYEILKETQHLLETAQIDDLPMLKNAYNVMLNRIPQYYVNKLTPIPVTYDIEVKSDLEDYSRIVKSSIPDTEELGPIIDMEREFDCPALSTINVNKTLNPQTGAYDPEVHLLPAKKFPRFCGCATALERIVREEMLLFLARLVDIEAQIAYTMDTSAPQQTTAFLNDPMRNPFLVYDPIASVASGAPSYANVAVNVNVPVSRAAITREGGPTLAHYQLAPSIRAYFARTAPLDMGGAVSMAEIDEAQGGGKIETGKILPWIIGAVAAAALAGGVL